MNVANSVLRLFLELFAVGGFAIGSWTLAGEGWRILLAICSVLFVTVLWGVFAVPDDPSRSGKAPVPVPGLLRLVLELCILLGGVYAWHLVGFTLVAGIAGALVVFHYLWSRDRILWLLQQ